MGDSQKKMVVAQKTPPTVSSFFQGIPKTPVTKFNDADRKKLKMDLNSPSASVRIRAIRAIKGQTPNKRYSMFDVDYKKVELVTEEDRKIIEELPKTIQEVFKDTVTYVEVRSKDDDRSEGIKSVIRNFGAQTVDKLSKAVTVVIFKEGLQSTFNKAKQMGIPVVSVLWIEACRKHLMLVNPSNYPISNLEHYEVRLKNPELYKKVRRPKPMTPIFKDRKGTVSIFAPVTAMQIETKKSEKPVVIKTENISNVSEVVEKIEPSLSKAVDEQIKPAPLVRSKVSPLIHKPFVLQVKDEKASQWTKAYENMQKMIELQEQQLEKNSVVSAPHEELSPTTPIDARSIHRRKTLNTENSDYETLLPSTNHKIEADVRSANRRRTLYTPNPDYEIPISMAGLKINVAVNTSQKSTSNTTPKPINVGRSVRRTLLQTPPNPTTKTTTYTTEKQASARRRTVSNTIDIHVSTKLKVSITTNGFSKSSSTITTPAEPRKRKLDLAEIKENTPPKIKSFLTQSGKTLMMKQAQNTPKLTHKPLEQSAKKRRTLGFKPY